MITSLSIAVMSGVWALASAVLISQTVAAAVRRGTITLEGGVRHVPTDMDFSPTPPGSACCAC